MKKTQGQKEEDEIYKQLRMGIRSFKKNLKLKIRRLKNARTL